MKDQNPNEKRRVLSMHLTARQKDNIDLATTVSSPRKPIIPSSSRYGDGIKAILKNIKETIGDEQPDQNLMRLSKTKDAYYQIQSQNLFMQGPRSMIERQLLTLVTKKQFQKNTQNITQETTREANKTNNNSIQSHLQSSNISKDNASASNHTSFMKYQFQQMPLSTPRHASAPSFAIKRNDISKNGIPIINLNQVQEMNQDKNTQSLLFSNRNNMYQSQNIHNNRNSSSDANNNLIQKQNEIRHISPSIQEGGCPACGNISSRNPSTRFKELMRLNVENSNLTKKIAELQKQVEDIDEFKFSMEHRPVDQHFNERRIDLLKATISRHQTQIRRLTSLLQTSKKLLSETLAVIQFFKDISSKFHLSKQVNNCDIQAMDQNLLGSISARSNNSQSHKNSNPPNIGGGLQNEEEENHQNQLAATEQGILQQLDSKLANVSLKSLLNSISGEEKDSFAANFNAAYAKILAYERTNQEFKHMFSISQANNNNSRNPSNQRNNSIKNNCDKSRSNVSIDLSPAAALTPLHSNKNQNQTRCNNKLYFPTSKKELQFLENNPSVVISYKSPVKEFITKYKNYLPIKTIFDSFPSQHKDTLHNMLSVLSGVIKKADQGFKQVATFQLFKSNPFLYIDPSNRLDLPETLLNFRGDFETYLRFKDKMVQIHLSQQQIHQTEQLLSILLKSLSVMYQDTLIANKNDTSSEIAVLITNLRKAIEQLLAIGIIIGPDSGHNHAKILVVSTNINKEMELNMRKLSSSLVVSDVESENILLKQQPIASLKNLNLDEIPPLSRISKEQSQQKQQQQQHQRLSVGGLGLPSNTSNISLSELPYDVNEPDELRVLRVQRDVECSNDFIHLYAICENILDDLYRGIKSSNSDSQGQLSLAQKLAGVMQKLKLLFEMKNNMLLIKEAQIDFMKNQMFLYKHDINSCTRFVEKCQAGVSDFFDGVTGKFAELLSHFNSVMDSKTSSVMSDSKSRKNLVLHFKKTLQEILERIDQITNRPHPGNNINILTIQQQFNEKVTILTQSQDHIKRLLAH